MPRIYIANERYYGFWHFIGDCIMIALTLGFWLVWIFVREMRRRSNYINL